MLIRRKYIVRGIFLLTLLHGSATRAVSIPPLEVLAPNIGLIENTQAADLIIYALAANRNLWVFDFPTLHQQGETFNRVVALIERQGISRDKVLSDSELAQAIAKAGKNAATYAFGNDFRASELAQFFTLAESGNVALNDDELFLKDYLLKHHFIRAGVGRFLYVPPDRVILSIPQEQSRKEPDYVAINHAARNAILRHEISHGEFYANDDYAAYCEAFWLRELTEDQRRAFREFLGGLGYDTSNEELMINETQAYLFHTPDPRIFNPAKVRMTQGEIDALRDRFWSGPVHSRFLLSEHQLERSVAKASLRRENHKR